MCTGRVLTFDLNEERRTVVLPDDVHRRAGIRAGVSERELSDGQRFGGQQDPGAHVVLQLLVLRGHKSKSQ